MILVVLMQTLQVMVSKATSTLIRFRMPPFLIQRKRIQISASTLAFSNRFQPSTLAMRKRYVSVLRGRLIIEFMTSVFSKASIFVGQGIRKVCVFKRKRISVDGA